MARSSDVGITRATDSMLQSRPADTASRSTDASADVQVVQCQECGAKNALLPEQLQARNFCRKCGKLLDLSPEARERARRAEAARKQFLSGDTLQHQMLAGFYLSEPVGHGAMAVVYRAHDTVLERDVAVKVFPPSFTAEAGRNQRDALGEARAACRLLHPYTVQVYKLGEDTPDEFEQAVRYIAMEFVDGSTVERRLKQLGRLDVPSVIKLFSQACSALAEAHRIGVLHRDLKPANMLLTPTGLLKLVDFGLASMDQAEVRGGSFVGTPAYNAPEVFRGDTVNDRSDMYMLGVVMFELLTGERPFPAKHRAEVAKMHMEMPAPEIRPRVPRLPETVAALVMRCLSKTPAGRPSASEAYGLLRRIDTLDLERMIELTSDRSGWPLARIHADPSLLEAARTVPDGEWSQYAPALGLRSDPWVPPKSGVVAYAWPALRSTLEAVRQQVISGALATVVYAPNHAGKTVFADLIGQNLLTPPLYLDLATEEFSTGLLVEALLRRLVRLFDRAASSENEWLTEQLQRVAQQTDPNLPMVALDVSALASHFQMAVRSGDPLTIIVDHVTAKSMSRVADLVAWCERTTLRVILLTDDLAGCRDMLATLPGGRLRPIMEPLHLPTLRPENIQTYLHIRLLVAGGRRPLPTVTPMAAALLHQYSEGRPGRLQPLLHQCLLRTCTSVVQEIDEAAVRGQSA